jgi:hypothetical protein
MLTLLKQPHIYDLPHNYYFSISIKGNFLNVSNVISLSNEEQIFYKDGFDRIYSNGKLLFTDLILISPNKDLVMIKNNAYYTLNSQLQFVVQSQSDVSLRITINKHEKYNNPRVLYKALPFVWYNVFTADIGGISLGTLKYDILTKQLSGMNNDTDDQFVVIYSRDMSFLYNVTLDAVMLNIDNKLNYYPPSYIATDLATNSNISFNYDEKNRLKRDEFYIHCFLNPNLFMGYNSYYLNFLPNRNNTTWIFIKIGDNYGYLMEKKSEKVFTYNKTGYVLEDLSPNEYGLSYQMIMIKNSKMYQFDYIKKNSIELGYNKISNNEYDLIEKTGDSFLFRII